MEIKYVNKGKQESPKYIKYGDSGLDVRYDGSENITLNPLDRYCFSTGLFFELPENIEIQVRPRSGLALNHGITVLNTPGTVDPNYRGEIKVILVNLSNETYTVNVGERIAQLVFSPIMDKRNYSLVNVNNIDENTERSEKGFGSSGKY